MEQKLIFVLVLGRLSVLKNVFWTFEGSFFMFSWAFFFVSIYLLCRYWVFEYCEDLVQQSFKMLDIVFFSCHIKTRLKAQSKLNKMDASTVKWAIHKWRRHHLQKETRAGLKIEQKLRIHSSQKSCDIA